MVNKKKIFNYFSSKFHLKKSTKGWHRFSNPFDLLHDDNSMAINFDSLWIVCKRTGYSNFAINFISDYEEITRHEVYSLVDTYNEKELNLSTIPIISSRVKLDLPEYYVRIDKSDSVLANRARNYMISRGFNINNLAFDGFGFCDDDEWFGYIIIPFKRKGELIYYIGRDFIGRDNKYKYKNLKKEECNIGSSQLFYNEDALNIYDDVYLVEGWSDARTLGNNGIASLSWSLSLTQKSLIINSSCKSVTIIADSGFYKEQLENALSIVDYKKVRVINIDSLNGKDVNDLGQEVILNHSKNFDFENKQTIFEKYFKQKK